MGSLDAAYGNRRAYGHGRSGIRLRRVLLLQSRVIARRWCHRRWRCVRRRHASPESECRPYHGGSCAKSFHIIHSCRFAFLPVCILASLLPSLRVQPIRPKLTCDRHHFKAKQPKVLYGRIWSGVSSGEPLPSASARLISATMRRDSGTASPCRSAISTMTPCR
jgi:hypothetical protein